MTEICAVPPSQSYAQPTKYQLVFNRIANTVFYCTSVNLPGINLAELTQPSPFVDLPVPGDKLKFEPLKIDFLIDADYTSWLDLNVWMTGLGFPERFQQYLDLTRNATPRGGRPAPIGIRPPYSDATLIVFSNKNNPKLQFNFKDCFPTSLTGLVFDYQKSAEDIMTGSASFSYSYYTYQPV